PRRRSSPRAGYRQPVLQNETATRHPDAAPSPGASAAAATNSYRVRLARFQNEADGFRQLLPTLGLGLQLNLAFRGQRIELGLAPGFRALPLRGEKSAVLQSM